MSDLVGTQIVGFLMHRLKYEWIHVVVILCYDNDKEICHWHGDGQMIFFVGQSQFCLPVRVVGQSTAMVMSGHCLHFMGLLSNKDDTYNVLEN